MTELYNVTVCQDLPITRIEGEGKKSTGVMMGKEYTVVTYKGCTHAQIQFYRKTYPLAEITIEQTSGFKTERERRPVARFGKSEAAFKQPKMGAAKPGKTYKPVEKVVEPTYEHGSYADVINRTMDGEG
jgi:hypothetical protein